MTCSMWGTVHCWDPTGGVELRVVHDGYGPHAHSCQEKMKVEGEGVLVYTGHKKVKVVKI